MKGKIIFERIILALIILGAFISPAMAAAPTIDGSLADWGLTKLKTDNWAVPGTWTPDSGISFVIADNKDPQYGEAVMGVHIKGYGSTYQVYAEPKFQDLNGEWKILPAGGEPFDLEAIYVKNDASKVYIAIVTSIDPQLTAGARSGDIAVNADGSLATGHLGYEYAIITAVTPYPASLGLKQGDVVYLPKWEARGALNPQERPDVVVGFMPGGHVVGNLGNNFVYSNSWMTVLDPLPPNTIHPELAKSNWVIETALPKSMIGSPNNVGINNVKISDNCLNDILFVPEFPAMAISIGGLMGLLFIVFIGRYKKE